MKIIGLHGLPRSGKDTIALWLVQQHGYTQVAFAKPLKEAAAVLLNRPFSECNGDNGFDREAVMPEWGFSMRWFLQVFGTECVRDRIAVDFWTRRMRSHLFELKDRDPDCKVVITDVRFQNECDSLRDIGADIVGVVRPGCNSSAHSSDALLQVDWTIQNMGSVGDLWRNLNRFIKDGRL